MKAPTSLPKPVLNGEVKLRCFIMRRLLSEYDLGKIAKQLVPAWDKPLERWHLFKTVNWNDGNAPSVSTVASFWHGGQMAAALLLAGMRAQNENCPSGKLGITYQLVFEVRHPANDAVAWICAETGTVKLAKHWPARTLSSAAPAAAEPRSEPGTPQLPEGGAAS